jgi:hypothetical protein
LPPALIATSATTAPPPSKPTHTAKGDKGVGKQQRKSAQLPAGQKGKVAKRKAEKPAYYHSDDDRDDDDAGADDDDDGLISFCYNCLQMNLFSLFMTYKQVHEVKGHKGVGKHQRKSTQLPAGQKDKVTKRKAEKQADYRSDDDADNDDDDDYDEDGLITFLHFAV